MRRAITSKTASICFTALTGWSAGVALAQDKPSLAGCALRYGWVMTDHWLTTDLAEQAERAAFYQTNASAAELASLRQSLVASEQKLDTARELYTALNKTNSPEGLRP